MITHSAPLSEVRDNFRQAVDTVVNAGDEYVITRHGKPVAVLLAYDEYESLIETMNILSAEAVPAIREAEASIGETVEAPARPN
jgi:prevent-host-death family protein